jgi:hypothetical protein
MVADDLDGLGQHASSDDPPFDVQGMTIGVHARDWRVDDGSSELAAIERRSSDVQDLKHGSSPTGAPVRGAP